MKLVRYSLQLFTLLPLGLFSLAAFADISYTGQLQQELVSWNSPAPLESGFQIRDGGEQQLASHDVEGATYLGLFSSFHLTPNHQGLARFHFDLSQTEGLEQYEAYVGIQSHATSWLMGTISSPYKSSTAGWDPLLATFMQARGNGGVSVYHNGYVESAITYQSKWWGSDVGAQWSPENGSSLSLLYNLSEWDFALAYLKDESGVALNTAAKMGIRYRYGDWITAFQYESLKQSSIPARNTYFSLSHQDGQVEYAGSLGLYYSSDVDPTDLTYLALGMKYAIAKNNIIHFGYRMSSAVDDGSQSETAFGIGFRYSF